MASFVVKLIMLSEVIKFVGDTNLTVAKFVTKELLGSPKVDDLKLSIRIEIKSLESYLDKKKSKYTYDQISKIKSKCSSFRNEITTIKNSKKLENILSKVKSFAKESKK